MKASAALLTETIIVEGEPRQVTQNRFTALRAFEVYACTAGADAGNPDCAADVTAGWKRVLKSQADAFAGDNPRPVQPRARPAFLVGADDYGDSRALPRHRRPGTGQESFQGDQDNDPDNPTDCRVTTVDEQARAAELQVLSAKPNVVGAKD